ncbi:MAG: UDP-N-acetylglucosamine--N-acetylmuramyl-(pentapeptide) pyrophosphoryl-undecaprenol N-acetylglucosamine transferase [Phycisphaeraceae bacterium]|nr:UDP-N-acetylglucosamine--N-acetylmuramyl-(pentapeptide) pyrophosphoryl-undecaprenol N-acetylglucosamine transferase [Phycisphaeraceae bacterium]
MSGAGRTFIFAGGGTGGHLFPALAIAEQLEALSGGAAQRVFLCSDRALDAKILSAEGVEFVASPAKPIARSVRGVIRFVSSWGPALRQARSLVRERTRDGRRPVVVAMGGFVAAPAAQGARAEGAPVVMVNLDAVPGKANRWIAWGVGEHGRVFTSIAVAEGHGPRSARGWTVVPPIVRKGAIAREDAAACRRALGLEAGAPTLMVTGGSQGAASINRLVGAMLDDAALSAKFSGWQVLHQTGDAKRDESASRIADRYAARGVRAVVSEFVGGAEMAKWWGSASLAVARAGANTVAEAWANRVPTVFLPYPYHRDEHQKHNAAGLVGVGGAWLAKDRIEPEANMRDAGALLAGLMGEHERIARAREALSALPAADGAERIARALLELA